MFGTTMFSVRRRTRLAPAMLVLALVTALLSTWAVVGSATPASAARYCGHWDVSGWTNGDGWGEVTRSHYLRQGPYSDCPNKRWVAEGTWVYYHCYTFNEYGNRWWLVRVQGTNDYGWTSHDNLLHYWEDPNNDGWMIWRNCDGEHYTKLNYTPNP